MTLDRPTSWSVLGGGDAEFSGRLIGGCVEVVAPLAGTPYGDVPAFGREHADEGLVVYLEVCEHGRLRRRPGRCTGCGSPAGSSTRAASSSAAPRHRTQPKMTQHEAVADALGMLDVPVVLDADIGHTQPFLPLVNGALARVTVVDGVGTVTQRVC